nr:Magnetosome protein MamT [uncultured bacterium]
MTKFETWRKRFGRATLGTVLLAALIAAGLFWGKSPLLFEITDFSSLRRAEGVMLGRMPLPTEPSVLTPFENFLKPAPRYKLMSIKHIPPITPGGGMPHPYVGDCLNCHLITGGAPAGSQFKTPVGAVLENFSRVHKLGPPILPVSQQPHPPAGRCIKCHDIVVKVPLDPNPGVRWRL